MADRASTASSASTYAQDCASQGPCEGVLLSPPSVDTADTKQGHQTAEGSADPRRLESIPSGSLVDGPAHSVTPPSDRKGRGSLKTASFEMQNRTRLSGDRAPIRSVTRSNTQPDIEYSDFSQVEVVLKRLELKLEALRNVPQQLQALQDLPRQLTALATCLNGSGLQQSSSQGPGMQQPSSQGTNQGAKERIAGSASCESSYSVQGFSQDFQSEKPGNQMPPVHFHPELQVPDQEGLGVRPMTSNASAIPSFGFSAPPPTSRRASLASNSSSCFLSQMQKRRRSSCASHHSIRAAAPFSSIAASPHASHSQAGVSSGASMYHAGELHSYKEPLRTMQSFTSVASQDVASQDSEATSVHPSRGRLSRQDSDVSRQDSDPAGLGGICENSEAAAVSAEAGGFPSLTEEGVGKGGLSSSSLSALGPSQKSLAKSFSSASTGTTGTFSKWRRPRLTGMGMMTGMHSNTSESGHFKNNTLIPDSWGRQAWDVLIICNTVLAATLAPVLFIYFDFSDPPVAWLSILVYYVDLVWPLDIVVTFRTGIYVRGALIRDPSTIAKHYAKGWFLPDLLSAWPLALTPIGSLPYVIACLLKFPRLIQLAPRFSRLRGSQSYTVGVSFVLVMCFLFVHLLAGAWRLSLRADGGAPDSHDSVINMYVSDMYFVSMTLTTVGFGDILPTGSASKLFTIVLMLLGSAVFGTVVTGCSILLEKLVNNKTQNTIAELERFMTKRRVPKDLQRRVRANVRRHLANADNIAMAPHLLGSLSPAMQRELCLAILSETVLRFPLFKSAQMSFVAELAQAHYWEHVLPGDLLSDEGLAVQEIIFVIEGCLQAWIGRAADGSRQPLDIHLPQVAFESPGPSSAVSSAAPSRRVSSITVVNTDTAGQAVEHVQSDAAWDAPFVESDFTDCSAMEIGAGAWLGEASLFDDDRVYTSVVTALTTCELAVLPSVAYLNIVKKYPRLLEKHEKIKLQIKTGKVSLKALAFDFRKQSLIRDNAASEAFAARSSVFNLFKGVGSSSSAVGTAKWTSVSSVSPQ